MYTCTDVYVYCTFICMYTYTTYIHIQYICICAGFDFIRERLRPQRIVCYWAHLLTGYGSLLTYTTKYSQNPPPYVLCTLRQRILCIHLFIYIYMYIYIFSMSLGALTDGLRFVTDLHNEIYPELLFVFVRCGSIYCVYVYLFKYICIYIFSMLLGALTDGLRFVTV